MTESTQPFVSILMSTYNSEKTILKAIESILHQDYTNFEFLILNDCSTDSTKLLWEKV